MFSYHTSGRSRSAAIGYHELTVRTTAGLALLVLFLALFLFYPIGLLVRSALFGDGRLSLDAFVFLVDNPVIAEGILNSLNVALLVTLTTALLSIPLAFLTTRCRFPGRSILEPLLLVPLILPPFVGAIGLTQIFARFGSANLMLMELGLIPANAPIDWFASRVTGIVIMEALHLFPIMYLCISVQSRTFAVAEGRRRLLCQFRESCSIFLELLSTTWGLHATHRVTTAQFARECTDARTPAAR